MAEMRQPVKISESVRVVNSVVDEWLHRRGLIDPSEKMTGPLPKAISKAGRLTGRQSQLRPSNDRRSRSKQALLKLRSR